MKNVKLITESDTGRLEERINLVILEEARKHESELVSCDVKKTSEYEFMATLVFWYSRL